jgi:ABC-type nitrate/sulfonate/bicarbonate transport system substrate-binding protein
MKSSPIATVRGRPRKLLTATLLLSAALLAAACSSSGSSSATTTSPGTAAAASGTAPAASGAGAKPSMSSVTIVSGSSPSNALLFIAQQEGFFKKEGLDVKWLNATTAASSATAVVLSGSAQFIINNTPSILLTTEKGGPLRGVFCASAGTVQEIALSASFAKAHNIPATATNQAEATAQFLALKGSHAVLAVSNTASQSYYDVITLAKLNHLTVGKNGDINVITLGTPTAVAAALGSGKVDGIVNAPPTTVQPNSIRLPIYLIPPVPASCGIPMATTTTMINDHPDVVQIVVNGLTQAINLYKSNPDQAKADAKTVITGAGTKDAAFEESWPSESSTFKTPMITQDGYNAELELMNDAVSPPVKVTYDQFVVTKFFDQAAKQFSAPS